MPGKLFLCATPIGNLGDVSQRLIDTLNMVDLVAAEDTRRTGQLLKHLDISKPQISYFEHNRRERDGHIVSILMSGKNVALVSDAGTPAVSDPGESLVAASIDAGVDIIPIPGPTAFVSALTVSGLPTDRFSFEGFLSVDKKKRSEHLNKIKLDDRTLIFYEAPHKLRRTLDDLLENLGDRRIAVCRELTKLHEEIIRSNISEVCEKYKAEEPRGEFVLVVEGADKTQTLDEWKDVGIDDHVSFYIERGFDEKEAIKQVARDRGVPKREIYGAYKT